MNPLQGETVNIMTILLELFITLAALAMFALLAARFGHDSRDGVTAPLQPAPGFAPPMCEPWRNMARRR